MINKTGKPIAGDHARGAIQWFRKSVGMDECQFNAEQLADIEEVLAEAYEVLSYVNVMVEEVRHE